MKVALVVLAALAVGAGASAGGRIRVHATISYTKRDGDIQQATLRIVRGGTLRLRTHVTRLSDGRGRLLGLLVRDLDGDGEPEVIVDFDTNGAHCCIQWVVYRYRSADGRYLRTFQDWGNVGYRVVDLDRDRRPELVSADDRFAYVFADFAESFFPVQVWHFRRGRFLDVTRRFPGAIEADSRALWAEYLQLRGRHAEVRGALAAWLADQYLLGRAAAGWHRLHGLAGRDRLGASYLSGLRSFLRAHGYAR